MYKHILAFTFYVLTFSYCASMDVQVTRLKDALEKGDQDAIKSTPRGVWYVGQSKNTQLLLAYLETKNGLHIFFALATLEDLNLPWAQQFAQYLYQSKKDEHYKIFADAIASHEKFPHVLKNAYGANLSQLIKWTHIEPIDIDTNEINNDKI